MRRLPLALFLTTALAACGSDSDDTTSSTSIGSGGTAGSSGGGTAGSSSGGGSGSSGGASTSGGSTSAGSTSGGSTSAASTSGGSTSGGAGGASFGDSAFGSVQEMFDYMNGERQSYEPHDRYRGFPFGGEYHMTVTWPMVMQWSDEAAALAQAEADAVAQGAGPTGQMTFANPGADPLFVDGVNTANYMVSGPERPGNFETDTCTLCNSNPFMRMAVFYQDPGGQGPVLTKVGIGAADMGNGNTWWVFRFAE